MTSQQRQRRFVKSLRKSYHGEIGSSALYAAQARVTRDLELADKLTSFIRDENRHAEMLADMVCECGGRRPRPSVVLANLFAFFGWVSARLGMGFILAVNLFLERTGIDLYGRMSKLLPDGQTKDRYRRAVTEMLADEEVHQTWFRQRKASKAMAVAAGPVTARNRRGR
jgi:rubrerythrin